MRPRAGESHGPAFNGVQEAAGMLEKATLRYETILYDKNGGRATITTR